MANWQWFTKAHKKIFNLSGGRLGASMGGQKIVMINTIGRKSGQLRQVPVACYPHKEFITVVASNNGLPKDPVWWLNLQSQPTVMAQLGTQKQHVKAELLCGKDRDEAWDTVIKINPRQKVYAEQVERELPLVYLRPIDC